MESQEMRWLRDLRRNVSKASADSDPPRRNSRDRTASREKRHSLTSFPRGSHRHSRSLSLLGSPSRSVEEVTRIAAQVKAFLETKEGSSLRAWIHHFDVDHDEHVTLTEFACGMRALSFVNLDGGHQPQSIAEIFNSLDQDKSGELSLEEIDAAQATLWRSFRNWAATSFTSARDMIRVIGGREALLTEAIPQEQWAAGVRRAGWEGGNEEILFSTLNIQNKESIGVDCFKWLDVDLRRKRRQAMARERAVREGRMKPTSKSYRYQLLQDFKHFLKKRWGNYLRAWRCGLSPQDAMVIQKTQFLKACAEIGWHKDVKLLWKVFDKDDNGDISIEELDLRTAANLASFQDWLRQNFSTAREAYFFMDKTRTRKIREPEFASALKALGFTRHVHQLFQGLDREGKKWLILEDLLFLDRWKPPAYLLSKPNDKAMQDLKALLLLKFKSYLRAWRRVLDSDGSNRCNWNEFKAACERIAFTGDVAGAWRSFDSDLSGYISLLELDPVSSHILTEFKKWADSEFGSVRSAFDVFDNDGSKTITYQEFRRCCRVYNYEGDTHLLFRAFDTEDMGMLNLKEIGFLDEWDEEEDNEGGVDGLLPKPPMSLTSLRGSRCYAKDNKRTGSSGPVLISEATAADSGPQAPVVLPQQPQTARGLRPGEDPGDSADFATTDEGLGVESDFDGEDEVDDAAAAEIAEHEVLLQGQDEETLPSIFLTKDGKHGRGQGARMPTLDELLCSPRSSPAAFRRPRRLVRVPRSGVKAALLVRLPPQANRKQGRISKGKSMLSTTVNITWAGLV
eukprot:CAMPEP_0178387378 /NCGR_PEP_ID=MMETSP0689_2-20121128/9044_1 /TAXON_ID=160604 /ORGANISM="Amphidinium massartii, Strain CS-259" /LENGTH=793 /DNA_ID=CAMNT_0020007743 /DNA_START=36 /DNA_END=2415 /DNA_ORIENTATION=+